MKNAQIAPEIIPIVKSFILLLLFWHLNIRPTGHIAPTELIVAHCDYRTVGFQANRVTCSSRNRHNIPPIRHIAPVVIIFAHCDYCTIGF